ncbi:hypothetical protein RCH09_001630 [Actimicrobium sp. GrIS 1.19]|uniref:DUF1223 domain-containing protein n=1 Tax=Actimicrobium sp. GrIS 1.19 TaxID=3071708 RepID=UPI002E06732C|nr:hypothetical protein [Actimicrobium sp. GrIS 1.19]
MNSRIPQTLALCLALCGTLSPAIAQVCSKHSPAHTVALLELYTSEGCSSCPPADHHVSDLRTGAAGPALGLDQVVPLALHVDYWDYIGWKDIYSSTTYTERQNWLAAQVASRTIYTPEIFVAGRELRNWKGATAATVQRINAQPARAEIGISIGRIANNALPVDVSAKSAQGGKLFVALYENAITSDVKAGENRGVKLHHDYVVREWLGPIDLKGGSAGLMRTLNLPTSSQAKNLGVAAFVQSDSGEVLQALALPTCSG